MAIGQGGHVTPSGLALEARVRDGRWVVVNPDLGFPAGKNKTILADLGRVPADATRLRLRTNLEIYWDQIAVSDRNPAQVRTTRLPLMSAELAFRGYSETSSPRGDAPETPIYERVANTAQRWRDLVGYYTRFGDVNPLLAVVDDRYVIMNAGDELRLRFQEQPAAASRLAPGLRADWRRLGEGRRLQHRSFADGAAAPVTQPARLRRRRSESHAGPRTPCTARHRDDWEQYHTRFVTPSAFVRGLRR